MSSSDDTVRYLENGERVLGLYTTHPGDDGEARSALVDVLVDLMHYCRVTGINFEDMLRSARRHFSAENPPPPAEPLQPHLGGDWEVGFRRAYRVAVVCFPDKADQKCHISCGPATGGNGWPAVGGEFGLSREELHRTAQRIADCVNACAGVEDPFEMRRRQEESSRCLDRVRDIINSTRGKADGFDKIKQVVGLETQP